MPSMKDIKQRISNVHTTRQIIRAMDMVAATKLHKARGRLDGSRPMQEAMQHRILALGHREETAEHVFAARRKIKNTAYIVLTSNKGLCGGYNVNVADAALRHMQSENKNEKLIVVGSKGCDFFRRNHKHLQYRITETTEAQIYETAGKLAELASSLYLSGEVDEVFVVYSYFASTLNHTPRVEQLLPLPKEPDAASRWDTMRYEPDVHTVIDHVVPLYLHTSLFAASAEAVACEHAARMLNMDSAGKNATEVIDDLTLMFNRKRQAAITQELNEIVGGANILE